MTDIAFRYRDYKDPEKRGTYMLVNGRQFQKISSKQMSRKEIEAFRRQYILTAHGYVKINDKTYRKQVKDDHIREVKEKEFNTEITDIEQDPETKKWTREKPENRDYIDSDETLDEVLL